MNKVIIQNIKTARKKAGFTQEALAHAIGCKSGITIRRWETGVRNPSLDSIKEVADVLGTTVDKLLPQEWLSQEALRLMEMTLNEYQVSATRSINPALNKGQVLHHALHGLASEVGEIHGLFQKAFQGHPLDPDHLKKETGDALWMISEICTAMGWALEDVAQTNIDKLLARYPNGFEVDKSLHRKEGEADG